MQENGLRVIAIVMKRKWSLSINFMLRLKCLRSSQNEYFRIRSVETLCSRVIRFKPRLLLWIDIIPTFLSALFQCSRFAWITPFLVVLLLTLLRFALVFKSQRHNRFATYTKTLIQFLETIIAKSSLNFSGLAYWLYPSFLFATVLVASVKMHSQYFNIFIRIWIFSLRFQF